jgi:hypothetical protein
MSSMPEMVGAAIAALLTSDAAFVAELTAPTVGGGVGLSVAPANVISNRPFDQIVNLGQESLPCWVIEPIEMQAGPFANITDDDTGLTLGGDMQVFRLNIGVGLVWAEQNRDVAYLQRQRIPDSLVRLFLRYGDAGVAGCSSCVVTQVQPDQALNHPMQNLKAVLTADIAITRS